MLEPERLEVIECNVSFQCFFLSSRIIACCEGYKQNKNYVSKVEFGQIMDISMYKEIDDKLKQYLPSVLTILYVYPNDQLTTYYDLVQTFIKYLDNNFNKLKFGTFDDDDIDKLYNLSIIIKEKSRIMMSFDYSQL